MKDLNPTYLPNERHTFFGVNQGSLAVTRLILKFRDGRRISIHYASMPIIALDASARLHLVTHDYEIIIKGRNLAVLIEFLEQSKVTWIEEAASNFNDDKIEVIVEDIIFKSDLLFNSLVD